MLQALLIAPLLLAIQFASTESIIWKDGPPTLPPGTKAAVLEGSPAKPGLFTMRLKVPANTTIAPHWHPRDERVTVISGRVEVGFGETADAAKTTTFTAGGFYVNPPKVPHYLFIPEETVLQLTCEGPWELEYVDKK